jgi:hypothetical protein
MKQNKVQINTRVTPQVYAYLKEQAPSNISHYVEELIRKDMLDNIQDDVVARMKRVIIADQNFIEAVASKLHKQPAAIAATLQVDPRFPGRAWDPDTEEWVRV